MRKTLLTLVFALLALVGYSKPEAKYYRAENGQILLDNVPQYFIGTNLWYGPRLAVEDPARLSAELDSLKAIGVTNLRVLAVDPDWEGYDAFFEQIRSRGMCAVLFMNNAWQWSKGFADYLEEAGAGKQPRPETEGYGAYMSAMAAFSNNVEAQQLSWKHVRAMVERYKDEPSIFSWQISNEPRCFSADPATRDNFVKYIHNTAALIKSIDHNHMVSTGNEGEKGCEDDYELYRRVNDCADIDYITIHIWPYNWGWVGEGNVADGAAGASKMVDDYITRHLGAAEEYDKPLVIEEFGFPRDGFKFDKDVPTTGRDIIYRTVFDRVLESASKGYRLAGCNFWTWEIDPPQEAQGLNSVFHGDSTVGIIRDATASITARPSLSQEKTGSFPRQEWRLGWGDMMFETAAFYNTPTDWSHSYSGHIFGEYLYNLKSWLGVGGQIDWEGVWWKHNDGSFINPRSESNENFYNLSIMPTVRFTYFRKGIVTMYSGVGLGLNINGGSQTDYKGRQTVCAPVLGITAYGISLNWTPNWFGTLEIGGLNSLNNKNEVFMLGSRLVSISIGYRL